jgi:hypothetical protein
MLADIVSLVRFAVRRDGELVPFGDEVRERFDRWMAQQRDGGRAFTPEQVRWLEMMRDHIAANVEIDVEDFDYVPFAEQGGLGKASEVFGAALRPLLNELNAESYRWGPSPRSYGVSLTRSSGPQTRQPLGSLPYFARQTSPTA